MLPFRQQAPSLLGSNEFIVNPMQGIQKPRVVAMRPRVLSVEEATALMNEARGGAYFALYVLALTTVARQGELFALTWDDISLANASMTVNATFDGRS